MDKLSVLNSEFNHLSLIFRPLLSSPKAMATESHFLNLPPELRIIIYQYYLSNDGYIYNPRTRKLRDANNDPIDLRLMYTCRLVAREMDGIALGINTITFSTFSSTELRAHAFFQAETLRNLHHIKQRMFRRLHPCFTEDLKSRVGQVYPEFMPLFDNIDSDWDIDRMGHAPSILHKALDYTIQLASSHPQFAQISSECSRMHPRVWDEFMPDFNTVNSFPYEPWKTPTRDYLQRSVSFCGSRLWVSDDRWSMMPFSSKLSFSAAAASIQFLESIPASTRAHIRRVVLNEDELSVSNPQCHARGLIPFCQENPRLRIERRANLWKNVFLRPLCQNNDSFVLEPVRYTSKSEVIDQVSATITSSVALWIVEALALIPSGMPADSFSLVLGKYSNFLFAKLPRTCPRLQSIYEMKLMKY